MRLSLADLNGMSREDFVAAVGAVFEKSPWIAEAAAARRPFVTPGALLEGMVEVVETAPSERLLELLRAHPDLGARLEEVETLTPESRAEQRAAGLLDLPPATASELRTLLADYRARFDFPFIVCARLNNPEKILTAVRERLQATPEAEIATAWREVQKIAQLRLQDLLGLAPEDF